MYGCKNVELNPENAVCLSKGSSDINEKKIFNPLVARGTTTYLRIEATPAGVAISISVCIVEMQHFNLCIFCFLHNRYL